MAFSKSWIPFLSRQRVMYFTTFPSWYPRLFSSMYSMGWMAPTL